MGLAATPDGGLAGRRGGAGWFLLVALGCGALAATIAVRSVAAARREVPVVVAARTVSPLQRIGASDVRLADVPEAAVPAGALRSARAVVGQFTRLGLAPGEVVTAASLDGGQAALSTTDVRVAALASACRGAVAPSTGAPAGGGAAPGGLGGSASAAQPSTPGASCGALVGFTLALNADQGFDMVRAGDRVDVAAAYPLALGTVTQVIVADVPVLERIASGSSGVGSSGGSSGWLVVGCTAAAALRMELVEATGKLAVLLRPTGAAAPDPSLTGEVVDLPDMASGSAAAGGTAIPPPGGGLLPPASSGAAAPSGPS